MAISKGYLSEYFKGFAVKKLSEVEVNPKKSNQHEFQGISALKRILGLERIETNAQFIYFSDFEDDIVFDESKLTWYDSRENQPTRSEYRMYFPMYLS